ncbi:MAG TPA: AI-2E family transporter, partial [Chloroflexota bacterium]|nr:AI-2E family transporter [Chloroflexota bacterium]
GRAIAPVLLLFTLAALLAFILQPFVSLCERRLRMRRPFAVLLAYVLVAGVLTLLGLLLVPPLVDQARQLVGLILALARGLANHGSPWYAAAERAGLSAGMAQAVAALTSQLEAMSNDLARLAFTAARNIGAALLDLLLLFVIAYYMLTARVRLESLPGWLSPAQKSVLSRIQPEIVGVLARYLRARLLLSLIVGVLFGLASFAIGLPYPAILGTVAAVMELIPFLGPILGGIPALMVAAVEGPAWRVVAVVIAFVIVQQFEGNILAPRITAAAVRLHPLLVIFAVLSAAQISGIWGALLVTPLLGCLAVVLRETGEGSVEVVPPLRDAA